MKFVRSLKLLALLPIAFLGLVFLLFGLGEALGGDLSGLMHLVELAILLAAIWLCWKRPLWGGIFLLAVALFRLIALVPELFLRPPGSIWSPSLFLLILIPAISGGLFLWAGLLERKAALAK